MNHYVFINEVYPHWICRWYQAERYAWYAWGKGFHSGGPLQFMRGPTEYHEVRWGQTQGHALGLRETQIGPKKTKIIRELEPLWRQAERVGHVQPEEKAALFPTKSLDAEVQCLISFLFSVSGSCPFKCRIQDVPLLFKPVIVKIYNKTILVADNKQQASAWEFRCLGLDICSPPHHTHTHTSICHLF